MEITNETLLKDLGVTKVQNPYLSEIPVPEGARVKFLKENYADGEIILRYTDYVDGKIIEGEENYVLLQFPYTDDDGNFSAKAIKIGDEFGEEDDYPDDDLPLCNVYKLRWEFLEEKYLEHDEDLEYAADWLNPSGVELWR